MKCKSLEEMDNKIQVLTVMISSRNVTTVLSFEGNDGVPSTTITDIAASTEKFDIFLTVLHAVRVMLIGNNSDSGFIRLVGLDDEIVRWAVDLDYRNRLGISFDEDHLDALNMISDGLEDGDLEILD